MPWGKAEIRTAVCLGLLSTMLVACRGKEGTIEEQLRPNFLFILVDDQGWNGTSVEMIEGDSLFCEMPEPLQVHLASMAWL